MPRSFAHLPDYEIVRRIGRGAHATVSLAVERFGGRQVAVKHVVRNGPRDDRFIEQAEAEYEIARRCEHPFLRRCYDMVRVRRWLTTRELFLIMEYVDGPRMDEKPPQRLDDVIRVFAQVAEGLGALHKCGYAHADIKPHNILLPREDGVKIIDFGQSCPLGHQKERVQGTPDFMAPEQIRRHTIDQRTDVFNLGATAYWLLTKKYFWTMMPSAPAGSMKIEIESQRGNDPPHEMNPKVPLPLSRLVMDCCAARPDDRPRDMGQVISRLELVQRLNDGRRQAGNDPPDR